MELIVKKTHELTDNIISRYCEAYTSIFQHKKTPDFFKSEFMNTSLGYSFHSILIEDESVESIKQVLPSLLDLEFNNDNISASVRNCAWDQIAFQYFQMFKEL